jgi:hypothetical protein
MVTLVPNGKDKDATIAALQAEIARLKEARQLKLAMKVSEKGCLSLYGLSKFPVSLYASQWRRVIELVPQIQKFMEENKDKLTEKQ